MSSETVRLILYFSWFIKPVYGFLGDYFFPFYYRVKGYVVVWILTALGSTTAMLILLPKIESGKISFDVLLGLETLNIFCLGFIDAVCRSHRLRRGYDFDDCQAREKVPPSEERADNPSGKIFHIDPRAYRNQTLSCVHDSENTGPTSFYYRSLWHQGVVQAARQT